jgi:hypothetical protein
MAAPALSEKVVAIDRALKDARIPHAFGGALALAYYAEPRATIDVDVNVFVPTSRMDEIKIALAPLGVDTEVDEAALERDGQCRLWWENTAVDLFFSYDEVHEAMSENTRRVPFGDEEFEILSPEHLVICKISFDRVKDWMDIEQVLVAVEHFDTGEVDRWLLRLVGAEDHRKQRFDELVAQFRDT